MTSKMIVALVIALAMGTTHARTCGAIGWKLKSSPDTVYCGQAPCADTDAGNCCTQDTLKCGGNSITCDASKFLDMTKVGNDAGTTDADKKTNCCTDKAKCSSASCLAGQKKIAAADTTNCATNTCTAFDGCCEADDTKCGGNSITCDADKFQDPSKAGTTAGTSDADKKTNCCTAKVKCSSASCAAGQKKIAAADTTNCATSTCTTSDGCCIADDTKCGGNSITCDANKFQDPGKAGTTAGSSDSDKKTNCCTDKATCNNYEGQVGTASGANKFQTPVMIFAFAIVGVLAPCCVHP